MDSDARDLTGPAEQDSPGARDSIGRSNEGVLLEPPLVTPWWYHAVLGLLAGVVVTSQVLPVPVALGAIAAASAAAILLPTLARVAGGPGTSAPTGPRSRRLFWLVPATVALCVACALTLRFSELALPWVLVPAVAAAVWVLVLGRAYDDAVRAERAA